MITKLALPIVTEVGSHFISNYPPYSCWHEDQEHDFEAALEQPATPQRLSLYVHIPFCQQRCSYCYFRVYPRRDHRVVDRYIDAVLHEASLYRNRPATAQRPLISVYFGGGSPSYLSVSQLCRLITGLQERTVWSAVEEFTVECDPSTTTRDKFDILIELGTTRVSLGFQSLDEKVLREVGRDTSQSQCLEAFASARAAGFQEINIDLLAGLPGQTRSSLVETIGRVIELDPECVTLYQMELAYSSRLFAQRRAGRSIALPSWDDKRNWVREAFAMFEQAGYTIGSGYMAVRDPSRWRFIYTVENYWHGAELMSLGETAFGYLQGYHYQNTDTFDHYVSLLESGRLPVRRVLKMTPEEQLRREVILQLKTGALSPAYFRQKFGVDLLRHFSQQFEQLESQQLAVLDETGIRLTRDGLLAVDWLLPAFYLPQHQGLRYT